MPRRSVQRWVLLIGLLLLGTWLAFFDSHSIDRRVEWHREAAQLVAENESLRTDIARLEQQLQEAGSDEVVEKIAREQYGMRRPGERVYRVERVEE